LSINVIAHCEEKVNTWFETHALIIRKKIYMPTREIVSSMRTFISTNIRDKTHRTYSGPILLMIAVSLAAVAAAIVCRHAPIGQRGNGQLIFLLLDWLIHSRPPFWIGVG
jgi:hypothetical protein